MRARGLDVDVTFAALDVGHVTDRSVVPRVLAEVIAPLRARRGTAVARRHLPRGLRGAVLRRS